MQSKDLGRTREDSGKENKKGHISGRRNFFQHKQAAPGLAVHTQVRSMIEQVMEVCGCSRVAAERAVEAAGPGGELLSVDD